MGKEIKAKVSVKKQKKDDNTDESIRIEGLRKDVEKQGIDVSTIKAGIDALVQKNGENKVQVQVLSQNQQYQNKIWQTPEADYTSVRKN